MGSPQPCRPQHARCGSPPLPERPLQVKVVGLFSCPNFQIAKSAAEELKNETWEYSSSVISFVNDQLLGDALDLQKWAHEVWDIVDVKPSALYDALAEDFSTKFLRDTKHNFVFLDICIDSSPIGRLIFELYCDVCPKTCKNFQVLCTGKAGFSQNGIRLHYKDSIFHRIVPNGWIQGGDIVSGKGDNGESIYGPTFEDENFSVPHNKRGVLGMANKGRHSNGSQFYITLQATPYLDRKFVAFGTALLLHDICFMLRPEVDGRKQTAYVTFSTDPEQHSVKNVCSRARLLGFESWLCHSLAARTQARTFLCVNFFIRETYLPHRIVVRVP
ncbi:probable inactive peptidyl-prolyl cis-trans isomerase-like 6 isoform X2 [Aotus nancymaae]|uniref:probable inactive peptidyl-prolyl cis-trans isomerase-like 6 isoform X2 n=1 Tax=Aotus nancymaae TaxID=37293 RepID=UPI0030FE1F1D